KIEQAVAENRAPDLVIEGPERLVANWGEKGWMADLSDLWQSEQAAGIYDNVREACLGRDGIYYEVPLCMSPQCMAINYDMFAAADALQYIDEETHTWTTEGFIQAVQALTASGQKNVGILYCKNQSGDQGTRALVTNLYGGSFTDSQHTGYTVDSEEIRRALELLYGLEGITFDPSLSATDTIELFCEKESAMCFCWNASIEIQQTINNPGMGFEIFPMVFPTDQDEPRLEGGIWGMGIFDNGDEKRIEAAKTFIRYLTENDGAYTKAVKLSMYWPVRDVGDFYENDRLMTEYSIFTSYMDDYYQITLGWAEARTAWWRLLEKVGAGEDIASALQGFPAME
ncbi:MAG: extracellular solute-binding protein, partial [Oscillospiraceae bacterium]|nr:extracellular solute-binding protein [Oscillospiraceae bacterium]